MSFKNNIKISFLIIVSSLLLFPLNSLAISEHNGKSFMIAKSETKNTKKTKVKPYKKITPKVLKPTYKTLNIKNKRIIGSSFTVNKNSTITWVNNDATTCTMEFTNPSSGLNWLMGKKSKPEIIQLSPGKQFTKKFIYTGSYSYKINGSTDSGRINVN